MFEISTSIDYFGQKKAEKFFQVVLTAFGILGFIAGFYVQSFAHTLLITGLGVVFCSLVVLPPWPMWNKNQLKWQKPVVETAEETKAKSESDSKKENKKSK